MAASLHAELTGIFVLDSELLRLSALPAASETGLTSAQHRPLNPESMTRALRLQADRARRTLEATARRHRLEASFQLLQGNVLAEILSAARQTDLLALGVVGQMNVTRHRMGSTVRGVAAGAGCSILLQSPGTREGHAIVAVFGESEHAQQTLALAWQLASWRGAELVVLLDAAQQKADALETAARSQLDASEARDVPVRFETIGDFATLKGALRRLGGNLLLIPGDSHLIEGRQDELCTLDVPVLLARAAAD